MAAPDSCSEGQVDRATFVINSFSENDEVKGIVERVSKICKDAIALESDLERMTDILDEYQEQPHLLDPYLEPLICSCLDIVRDPKTPAEAFHQTFKYLYLVCKTRGAKYVVRFFSHEVTDMQPVLNLLAEQNLHDFTTWQTRYVLLLWLAIICMIPFDLIKFDGSSSGSHQSIINHILSAAKKYIGMGDKSRDAAAYLLSKFLSRPDVKRLHLSEFIAWCVDVLVESRHGQSVEELNSVYGILSVLYHLFKYGAREDLLKYAVAVYEKIEEKDFFSSNDILLKKLTVKVVQRLGMCLLKPKIASWRYQRGNRSLIYNLQNPFTNFESEKQNNVIPSKEEEEESYDIPENIEFVIQQLLLALRDRDTVVRWSAAKGIGRITNRLPKDLADDVIGTIMDYFSPMETDTSWHGGCLALAELGKRGLLLPERLPEVVPVILKALVFDERRGSCSSGAHVRDAACYACWSFARAYDPKELAGHVPQIASALVIVSIFDREHNCRRAASAAFQEHVGRQGTFPHGIEILTTVDYFAVGNISNCFLNLSVFVANFPEYTQRIIDHLVSRKISHWDSNVRELASRSLARLTAVSPDYIMKDVLPKILLQTTSSDLNTRHGGILATAEIIEAVSVHFQSSNVLDDNILQHIKDIVPCLKTKDYFSGIEGDYMKAAVCKLIEKVSIARVALDDDNVIGEWQEVIDECLPHTEPSMQDVAAVALNEICKSFYGREDGTAITEIQESLVNRYLEKLKSSLKFDRMGFTLGLGAMPSFLIKGKKDQIISGLLNALVIDKMTPGLFAEARTNAIKALTRICQKLGLTGNDEKAITKRDLWKILDSFILCMQDYSIDSRGDVGAWVREAAMTGTEELCNLAVEKDASVLPENVGQRLLCCLVQQSAEKIDRTRAHAGETLLRIIHLTPKLLHIPHHQELLQIFPRSEGGKINWAAPSSAFPIITKLFQLPAYRYSVILGIIVSVGGLTESLVRHASHSVLEYLWSIQSCEDKIDEFTNEIVHILEDNKKNARVTVPLFRMLDLLISNGCFDSYANRPMSQFPENLVKHMKNEVSGSRDTKKLTNSIKVFCGLIQFPGEGREKTLSQLMLLLCHKYPRIRKETAECLYTTLITYEEAVKEENYEQILTILSETEWDDNVEQLRVKRNDLCNLLEIPKPKLKKNNESKETIELKDDLESYQDLVTRHGY